MNRAFYLDDWLVEPDLNRVSRCDADERLRPQVMDLLVYFIQHRREVITSDDILAEVWAGKVTTHASIYNCVKELRHALHDDFHQPRYIKTIPKRGYQVIADVRFRDDSLQLWSETFDPNLNEIFEVQNDISTAVIGTLRIKPPGVALSGKATHPDAYALYLQGRYFENLRGNDNRLRALDAYQRALAIDPDYAPAWVGISWHYSHRNHFGGLPREEGYSLALEALDKALSADNSLASAWATLG